MDDLHRFWCSLVAGQIVGSEVVQAMVTPRHRPHDGLRYGLGCYLHPTRPALLVEGYDAGVSMRSIHDPATQTTATVLANSSEGAWPVAGKLLEMFD